MVYYSGFHYCVLVNLLLLLMLNIPFPFSNSRSSLSSSISFWISTTIFDWQLVLVFGWSLLVTLQMLVGSKGWFGWDLNCINWSFLSNKEKKSEGNICFWFFIINTLKNYIWFYLCFGNDEEQLLKTLDWLGCDEIGYCCMCISSIVDLLLIYLF